ncbi:hypothetical protein [Mycobacterium sp.]|nr:hypothetical protein [Mycobacterium sp.]
MHMLNRQPLGSIDLADRDKVLFCVPTPRISADGTVTEIDRPAR